MAGPSCSLYIRPSLSLLSSSLLLLIPMSTEVPKSKFAIEGGKFLLATALFNAHGFDIRCPDCPGNRGKPGFIKDSAGKADKDSSARRFWKCQRANGTRTPQSCTRVSCTQYIELAISQLGPDLVGKIVASVCRQHPPDQDTYGSLKAYQREFFSSQDTEQTPSYPSTTSSLPIRTPIQMGPGKRKVP
jgi:hypothetical protein